MACKLFVVLVIINLVWSRPPDINVNVKQYINGCCPGNCCPRQDQAAENILLPHLTSTTTEVTTTTDRTTTTPARTTTTTDRTTTTTDRTTTTPARTTTTTVRTTTQDPCDNEYKGGCEQLCTKDDEEVICCVDNDYSLQEDGKTCKLIRYKAHQSGKHWHFEQCDYLSTEQSSPSLASCMKDCDTHHKCTSLHYNSLKKLCDLLACDLPNPDPERYDVGWTAYSKLLNLTSSST